MRVTHRMLVRTALRDLQNGVQALGKYQEQLASGKRLHRPSDDPFAVQRAINMRGEIQALEACRRSISLSQDWVNATDVALDKLTDVLIRARNVALRGADDSIGSDARQAVAMEAAQLVGSALQCANSSTQGRYLFAGYKIDQPPFVGLDAASEATTDPDAIIAVEYRGDDGAIVRELEPGVSLQINVNGTQPWLAPDDPASVFALLLQLRDALAADDAGAVRGLLDRFEAAVQAVGGARAMIGAKSQRLAAALDKLEAVTLGLQDLLSQTEDVDMAEAVVHFAQREAVLKVALQVNARILPTSLLDYLR
ncbi:MAG: flagellar hook-associated protein FlgL [Anaerolineae bacterium]|nr:flagellar hook-associated protein FlgL [Anaerolineae bacterium]